MNHLTTDDPDEFAVLTAVWILASNDENPIITYKGIQYRLGLSTNFNLKKLINQHGELFRLKVSQERLDAWKERMRNNRRSMPTWIRDLPTKEEQFKLVESLTVDAVFRSQFRTVDRAPKSPIEIIDWGLQHIERLRKAKIESREHLAKQWQVWVAIVASVINLILTIINMYLVILNR